MWNYCTYVDKDIQYNDTVLVFFRFNDSVVFVKIPMYDSNLAIQIVRPVVNATNEYVKL